MLQAFQTCPRNNTWVRMIDGRGMPVAIGENHRNRKKPKRGRKRFFDENVYKKRFVNERIFAWLDGFKTLLIQYDKMIARLFNVSRSTVLYWIRTMGSKLPEPVLDTEIQAVSIDEMWHFICKKNEKYGSGGQWIAVTTKPSAGLLAIVMLKHFDDYTKS